MIVSFKPNSRRRFLHGRARYCAGSCSIWSTPVLNIVHVRMFLTFPYQRSHFSLPKVPLFPTSAPCFPYWSSLLQPETHTLLGGGSFSADYHALSRGQVLIEKIANSIIINQRVFLLDRLYFTPSEIAMLTGKNLSSITMKRVRLLDKLFHVTGKGSQFDAFIRKIS